MTFYHFYYNSEDIACCIYYLVLYGLDKVGSFQQENVKRLTLNLGEIHFFLERLLTNLFSLFSLTVLLLFFILLYMFIYFYHNIRYSFNNIHF